MNNFFSKNLALVVLSAFLVLVFLTGGSARSDVQSLVLLRPVSILCCGVVLWKLAANNEKPHRMLLLSGLGIIIANALYLLSLPGWVSDILSTHGVARTIDSSVLGVAANRPLTMDPAGTLDTLFSCFIPLAAMLLLTQISKAHQSLLLPIMIALALGSGLLGIMQSIAGGDNALYFYNITNKGVPVGAFANRNHQAILLAMAFPMLAVYASAHSDSKFEGGFRKWIAVFAGAVLVPLILVTGSRTGLLLGAIGIIGAAWLYQPPKSKISSRLTGLRPVNFRVFAAITGVAALGGLTLLMSRAAAIQRLVTADELSESRSGFWNVGLKLFWDNFPLGSGPGTFAKIYASAEPTALLDSTYLNHAHNDLLELAISYGLPGLVILTAVTILMLVFFGKLWQTKGQPGWTFRCLGFLLLFIAGIGSAVDYPLRTPLIATLMVIAVYWCIPTRSDTPKNRPPVPKSVEYAH